MKRRILSLFVILGISLLFFAGCSQASVPAVTEPAKSETVAADFPDGQRLLLKVTPGNGYGGMNIAVSGKGSNPHVSAVEDVLIYLDGNFMDLGEAIEEGLITVEEMDAYARLDAKNGFCRMEYASANGLSLYVYHYDGFDIGSYYDVYEAPDGTKKHFQQFQIVTGNRYQDVGDHSVDYPYGAREDWGLTFAVKEAASDHITLQITQSGGQHFGALQIGPSLFLEKDTGGYFKEPYHQTESRLLQKKDCLIANDSTTEFVIPWPRSCGELSDGEYTMHIRIEDHFDPEQIHPFTRDYNDHQIYQIDFSIGDPSKGIENIELLSSQTTTEAVVVRIGNTEFETVEAIEAVTLTSAVINRAGLTIEFIQPPPLDSFDCVYLNMAQFYNVPYIDVDISENIYATMKDGTKIEFFQTMGGKTSIHLTPEQYIELHNLVSITLADGTELRPSGS